MKLKTLYLIFNYFSLFTKIKKPIILSVIRLNGKFGIGEDNCFSALPSSIAFNMQRITKNWDNICAKAIDIHRDINDSEVIRIIKKELFSIETENFPIGITENMKRNKIELKELKKVNKNRESFSNPNHRSVYIVSGGLLGYSFEIIKKLAVTCKSNFIVLGNVEQMEREPRWAKDLKEVSQLKFSALNYYKSKYVSIDLEEINQKVKKIILSRKIKENIKLIKSYGSSIIYRDTDIINPYHIKNSLKYGESMIGKINGIIYICENSEEIKVYGNIKTKLQSEFDRKILGLKNIIKNIDKSFLESIYMINFNKMGLEDSISADDVFEKMSFSISACIPKLTIVSITCNINEELDLSNEDKLISKNDIYRYEFIDMTFEIIKGSYGSYKNYILKN